MPQLLAGREVTEARDVFLGVPVHSSGDAPIASDFLKKPAHVAEEEQGNAMEDLEFFNQQMLSAEQNGHNIEQHAQSTENTAISEPGSVKDTPAE